MNIYFDNAATTRVRDEVISEISNILKDCFGNPSSTHSYGRSAKSYIESSRKKIAEILNCETSEIIFNSGGTESDNSILRCSIKDLGIKQIISSKIEHHAITHTLNELEKEGVLVNYVDINDKGEIDYNHLEELLGKNDDLKLVTLMYINNEIGNILDVRKVSDLCKKSNSLFHTDAVQAVGHYEIDLKEIQVDFLSAAGHKFHGPKGVGFSFIRKTSRLSPFICGGPQERGLRAGTESVHNIVGMTKALEVSYDKINQESNYIRSIKEYTINELRSILPKVHFNGLSGNLDKSTYTILNVCFPLDSEKASMLDFHLDLNGIACSKGSACQSGSSSGSHVLNEVQTDALKKYPSVRFSFSHYNTKKEVDYLIKTIKNLS
ncbi:MAG: cysteine desulfurase family protein [Candidatus Marisimplicoccus sp.]